MRELPSWDIFCRVVDNFGDAGVCWRLARELSAEGLGRVRLWIDDLESLARLEPRITGADEQSIDAVQVAHWSGIPRATQPAQIIVEAFGCGVPDEYVAAVSASPERRVWIVLEYLSAEAWVIDHHGLPSPHPRLAAERYFFFPGFVEGTGGLLRERDLFARRDRFDFAMRRAFWESIGFAAPAEDATTISLFSYGSAPVRELMRAWGAGDSPIVAAVADGPAAAAVLQHFGISDVPTQRVVTSGALEVRFVPFLPQARYDELLWACECNFVRGEDSFVRAQWAARPFVWQPYPQQDSAHAAKLEAFLALYCAGLPATAAEAVARFSRAWNQLETPEVTLASAWQAFARELPALRRYGPDWADRIAAAGGLAGNLARFCSSKVK